MAAGPQITTTTRATMRDPAMKIIDVRIAENMRQIEYYFVPTSESDSVRPSSPRSNPNKPSANSDQTAPAGWTTEPRTPQEAHDWDEMCVRFEEEDPDKAYLDQWVGFELDTVREGNATRNIEGSNAFQRKVLRRRIGGWVNVTLVFGTSSFVVQVPELRYLIVEPRMEAEDETRRHAEDGTRRDSVDNQPTNAVQVRALQLGPVWDGPLRSFTRYVEGSREWDRVAEETRRQMQERDEQVRAMMR
ncbi:hypothetical protein KVT40_004740 [Elsinoe batatas]|uniref:Uncharacterized protein n=1 Tax=Elsinoe batatas TaxID=2601811 RepID=A0A8K0PG71_9PEZI|nr:hypothetical protein KVT40_004740 [Elsinoe batatas]